MHRILLCTLGALALGVGFTGLAWACTSKSYIDLSSPSAPEGGSTITVSGYNFIPGPVKIHIDSGPVLATATGPNFKVDVKVPKAKPGLYYVRAIARQSKGDIAGDPIRGLQVIPTAAPKASEPVPSSVPSPKPEARAPARERPRRATPEPRRSPEPRTTPATSAPVAAQAPSEGDTAAPAKVPVQAESPAATKRPAKVKSASEPAAPQPAAITPLVSSLRSPWSGRAVAGPGLEAASASAKPSGGIPSLGVGLLVLGFAMLGGAVFALVRARPRPPASEATVALPTAPAAGASAMPVTVPPSLEEELEELIAASAAREEEPAEPAASGELAPREPAGAPH